METLANKSSIFNENGQKPVSEQFKKMTYKTIKFMA
jgi:hypothetical protein